MEAPLFHPWVSSWRHLSSCTLWALLQSSASIQMVAFPILLAPEVSYGLEDALLLPPVPALPQAGVGGRKWGKGRRHWILSLASPRRTLSCLPASLCSLSLCLRPHPSFLAEDSWGKIHPQWAWPGLSHSAHDWVGPSL